MLKPICVRCHRFYRMKKSGGYYFREGMPANGISRPPPGIEGDAYWQDYKLWSGDLWECLGCGNQIISGSGMAPLRERHHEDFDQMIKKLNAEFRVNDC